MGDLLIGSYLQFETITPPSNRPLFAHRVDIAVQAPTGKCDATKQINPGTNTWAINGVKQSGSEEQVLGLGPGAMWIATRNDAFFMNLYFETAVENRFAANVFQARWARTF